MKIYATAPAEAGAEGYASAPPAPRIERSRALTWGLWLGVGALLAAPLLTTAEPSALLKAKPSASLADPAQTAELRITAEKFVEQVNYARMAVATEKPDDAKTHIAQARTIADKLGKASKAKRRQTGVQSGRVVYDYDTEFKNHYFPVEAGPVKVKNVETGPFWSSDKGAAVTDAELVYITIDLSRTKGNFRLDNAQKAIDARQYDTAEAELAKLAEEVVTVDSSLTLPLEKARDNLALARSFIQADNYPGARYALGYARDALDSMEDSAQYAKQRDRILAMRTDLILLQDRIAKNDPTALEKAGRAVDGWWNELKGWSTPSKK